MDMGYRFGRMGVSIKGNTVEDRLVDTGNLSMVMVMFTPVNGILIKQTATVSTLTLMAIPMKANGKTMSNMVKAKKSGSMAPNSQAITLMESNMVTANKYLQINLNMKVNGGKVRLREEESIGGQMRKPMKDSGKIIRCMDSVFRPGQMGESIVVITLIIKKKEKGCTNGQTVEYLKVTGKTISNMEKVCISCQMGDRREEDGLKEEEQNGLKNEKLNLKKLSNCVCFYI